MKTKTFVILFFVIGIAILILYLVKLNFQNRPLSQERLDVYNWPYYIDEGILVRFEKEYNCIINYKEFPTNEDLLNDLEFTTTRWDVIFPTDYMVEIMSRKGLLSEIDKSLLSNLGNIDPNFLNKDFDRNNVYSLPFIWGVTGIGYDKNKIDTVTTYEILWNETYRNRIGLLDDMRFTIAMPLLMLGEDINTTNLSILSRVEDLLRTQKRLVKAYNSDNYVDLLISGEVDLFYGYSGDIIQSIPDNPNLAFAIPKEGGVLYIDNMCIPEKSDNKDLAHKFIDFLLEPEIAAYIINTKWFALPNKAAEPKVKDEIRNHEGVYPPDDILEKCQMLKDLGAEIKLHEELWKRVKR
jgi:spermidine/putrescine-binding protein